MEFWCAARLKSIGLKKDTKPENFSDWHRNATFYSTDCKWGQVLGTVLPDTEFRILALWYYGVKLIYWLNRAEAMWLKGKKNVKRRKKDICQFCAHFWTLCQGPRASQCGTGWATLPHGVLRDASSGDLVGEGISLWKASCSVVEVKSTATKSSWASPAN